MSYTIKQVSKMTNIPASTLRYYDKEGLLPFLQHSAAGYRIFSDIDLASLQILQCLKETGLSINEIKQFSEWIKQGDRTLQQRYEMFVSRKIAVEKQITELQKSLDIINHKCNYYKTAVAAGTEKNLLGKDTLPHYDEFISKLAKS